jgi:hypothetical protein
MLPRAEGSREGGGGGVGMLPCCTCSWLFLLAEGSREGSIGSSGGGGVLHLLLCLRILWHINSNG